jgi:hypothetical protein
MPEPTIPTDAITPELIAYRITGSPAMYVLEVWGAPPASHILAAAIAHEHDVDTAAIELITSA